jgi:hypothetical protein
VATQLGAALGILRIFLSILAVIYDVLMFALFLTIFIAAGGSPGSHGPGAGNADAPVPPAIGYVVMAIMLGGFVLNILAIAFGARLPIGRKPQIDPITGVAQTFS